MASWLVARWFLGGELVGGETPWWRGDRKPVEESGEPLEIDECSEPPKKKVARKKVIAYFMLSLFLYCYVKSN